MKIIFVISDHGFGHAGRSVPLIFEFLRHGHYVHVVTGVDKAFYEEYLVSAHVNQGEEKGLICSHFINGTNRKDVTPHLNEEIFPNGSVTKSNAGSHDHLERIYGGHLTFEIFKVDVGVCQNNALDIDLDHTYDELCHYIEESDTLFQKIYDEFVSFEPDLVVFDICCLVPSVTQRYNQETGKNIPTIAICNFAWDGVYLYYAPTDDRFTEIGRWFNAHYSGATVSLRLPSYTPSPGLDAAPFRKEIGWTGRMAKKSKKEVFEALELDLARRPKVLLVGLGGHSFDYQRMMSSWKVPKDWVVLVSSVVMKMAQRDTTLDVCCGDNRDDPRRNEIIRERENEKKSGEIRVVDMKLMSKVHQISFVDILAASDVVLTKTGYATFSEIVLNGTRCLFVLRDDFQEQESLVRQLQCNAVAEEVTHDCMMRGDEELFELANGLTKRPKVTPPKSANVDVARLIMDIGEATLGLI